MTTTERTRSAAAALERYGFDVVDLETLRYGLIEVARDMHETLMRGGFSPIVRDVRDCTAAIHMRTGDGWEMVASWEGCVQHAFTSQHIANFTMADWDEAALRDGDVIMVNDPWRGSVHCSDINVFRPVIVDGRVEFLLHTTSHVADLGGPIPGGFANGTRTSFEEQLKFPPTLLYAEGVPVRPAFNYLLENNRVPHLVLGDVRALSGSLQVGARRLRAVVDRYGLARVKAGGHYGMDMTEAAMRAGIARVPDGDYPVSDFLDDDSISAAPVELAMTVKVRGDSMEIDYSGTSRQPEGNVGTAWIESTRAIIGAKFILDPASPVNSGTLRPVEAILPPGSAVCVLPPSSCSNHVDTGSRVVNLMTQAMASAMSEQAIACDSGTAAMINVGGVDTRPGREGTPWATFSLPGGGWGGTWKSDGLSLCLIPIGNCRSSVQEHVERENPVIVWEHELMPDSAGAGENRGGAGGVYTVGALSPTVITITGDRVRGGGPGVRGGGAGMPFYAWLLHEVDPAAGLDPLDQTNAEPLFGMFDAAGRPDPDRGEFGQGTSYQTAKIAQIVLQPGQGLRLVIGGGGGWGDPLVRDTAKVLADVEDGVYSTEFAESAYGVVLRDGSVDEKATAAVRADLAAQRDAGTWTVPTACPPRWRGRVWTAPTLEVTE
ncbi:hydantoinase B/oxoprolinase family protein [Amycolatopsis sp. Poz14]|uniref:hydantoinase B/oxoprolinase family protein n=1 Tax=Amycolatopsis sp. Poz14 TaxID=1447705 RepID=UPI001EE944D1|nr:hydantoinase B/oxoprolinase family protein [Amycolatopsis sp. Poz14]MCG3753931.1 hydantoinase B/oxoprolinase family protein [Amycolatopsis sp. Poz14]